MNIFVRTAIVADFTAAPNHPARRRRLGHSDSLANSGVLPTASTPYGGSRHDRNQIPGLLLDAACGGLGIALVSQLLAQQARASGLLQPLAEQSVRGPNWAWLIHRDSASSLLTRSFCDWLEQQLSASGAA